MNNKTTTKQITVDETTLRQFKSMLVVLIDLMPDYAEQKVEEKKRKRKVKISCTEQSYSVLSN